jgi:molybdopterin-containing oxidoreductase family iron-sulfur binding subunit
VRTAEYRALKAASGSTGSTVEPGTKENRSGLSRRKFLGQAGAATLAGAMAAGGGLRLLSSVEAQGGEDQELAKHQWVMVIDLRRCDGCGLCEKACQSMHHLSEDQEWLKIYKMKDSAGGTYFMPRPCMQCENAPCLKVCPVGATYKVPDGVIVVDQSKCIGCRMCMAACPYDARYFNWGDPPPAPNVIGKPQPEFPVPQQKGTVGKCILCVHNTRYGKLPGCVASCPMHALYIGDLKTDLATDGVETVKLSELLNGNHVVRYKESLGTRPRVYYILGHGQTLDG